VPAIGWAAVTRDAQSTGAVGLADVERREPATSTTAFEAASIAKTIIATCVMQLVEEGRLTLDADVSRYVGFPVRHPRLPAPITLRQLLTHTASIADREETRAGADVPLADFLRSYFADAGSRAVFLDAAPGASFAYSNVGPSLAALAVERVTGACFADLARARVFAPLGMHSTAFGHDALPAGTRIATPYAMRGERFVRLPPPSHALYPVVDLFSTPDDLSRFGRAILRGGEIDGVRILSNASVSEMLRVQLPEAAPGDALGWQVRTFGGRRVVGHEGEDSGASTGLYLDMASGAGAVVVANGDAFQGEDSERATALGDLVEKLLASARLLPPVETE
jgi:CubicO group peptidase (beta-lactamase class C family)